MVTDGSHRSAYGAKATPFQQVTAAFLLLLAAAATCSQTGDDPVDLDHPAIGYRTATRTANSSGVPAFDALPQDARDMVYARLKNVLSGQERAAKYARLSAADRAAILEIVRETKNNLPPGF